MPSQRETQSKGERGRERGRSSRQAEEEDGNPKRVTASEIQARRVRSAHEGWHSGRGIHAELAKGTVWKTTLCWLLI